MNKSKLAPFKFSLIIPPPEFCGIKSIAVSKFANFCVPSKVEPLEVHLSKQLLT